jgi:hypothetical protein
MEIASCATRLAKPVPLGDLVAAPAAMQVISVQLLVVALALVMLDTTITTWLSVITVTVSVPHAMEGPALIARVVWLDSTEL